MKYALPFAALLALAACSQPAAEKQAETPAAPAPAAAPAPKLDPAQPAGTYALDPMHSTVIFKANHLTFSKYVAGFDRIAGTLQLDPKNPDATSVEASVDLTSLDLPAPPAGFKTDMLGQVWFDAGRCKDATFKSTKVTRTGDNTADVAGDLTLRCTTKPVVFKATFNGGYAPNAMDGARIGFSAHTVIKRSEFGLSYGIPAPGSNMGVPDEVIIEIETEFTHGAPTAPPAPAAK